MKKTIILFSLLVLLVTACREKKEITIAIVPKPVSLELSEKVLAWGGPVKITGSSYMTTPDYVEYMVYPRASAMAEVLWSPKDARNYPDFLLRMESYLTRLDERNIHYAKHILKEIDSLKTK